MKVLTLSLKAINDLIIEPEVSNRKNYEARLQAPIWPGGTSGVTIGLGYDIGMTSKAQLSRDWEGVLPAATIARLSETCGKIGIGCKKLLPGISDIKITWEQACECFYRTSLPKHAKEAANVYPELETLHPYEQTAIVGLVYNRGAALKGDRRREMLALVQAIKDDNDKLMGAIIRQMKRLWTNAQRGLLIRRDLEAQYIEMVDIPIEATDQLLINIV